MSYRSFPPEEILRHEFGARLTVALEALEIRPTAAAAMVGASPSRFTHWAKGRHWPDSYKLAILCHMTGLALDYLILGRGAGLPAGLAAAIRARETKIAGEAEA